MNKAYWQHRRRSLDRQLQAWQSLDRETPSEGWLRSIREALGWTAEYTGQRVGISGSAVLKLEQSEAQQTITLKSLQQVAETMDCDVCYALVPRRPLDDMVLDQARKVARAEVLGDSSREPLSASDQEVVEARTQELMANHRALWKHAS